MTLYNSLQSISSRLDELTHQLSTSKLSKEELTEFELLSRKLYERAVILNYKSKEEHVYGDSLDKKVNPILPFSNEEDEVVEVQENTPISEIHMDAFVEENDVEEEKLEVDNSVNNDEATEEEVEENEPEKEIIEEDGRVQFDFSGGFDALSDEEKSEVNEVEKSEPESIEINDSTISEESRKVEPLNRENREAINEAMARQKQAIFDQKRTASRDAKSDETTRSDDQTTSFYERFSKAYKAAAGDRLGTSKIDSLKGAIGLNDRMLFINELFNGDSNYFNDTIETLDQLENNEVAMRKLSEIAVKENWNKEDSSVDEFAHLITRRYVD
ncbi:hypothetical protein [Brumimicrobium mesophilum]|uniref:hypothetical protein n=1 Tax=Brumimicrobium mesophilum TaxID=392717 RepID=UPI000D142EA6|nr:hypothetical protein [Brumimicrobium mesophilum]